MGGYSENLNAWAGFSGKKGLGYCAICGKHGSLTHDHVPPKGCIQVADAVLTRLTMGHNVRRQPGSSIYIQGGLKFKTLCVRCNSQLLGLGFDPELKHFVDSMRVGLQKISMNVVLPRIVQLEADMHLIARSVIGHILAAHSVPDTETPRENIGASEVLRQYFLDPTAAFPQDWRLYCWPYLSRKQVILRHAAWLDTALSNAGDKTVYGHVLKFLPFGFWLVYRQPTDFFIDGLEITPAGAPDAQRVPVSFNLRHAPHLLYPENPSDQKIMLFADDQSSVAMPAPKRVTIK